MNELTASETVKKISREIIDHLMRHPNLPQQKITNLKGKIGKKYNYHKVIKNAQILHYASEEELDVILQLLKRRITRTISGVSVIAIMTKPLPCPGNCVYCPG